MLGLLIGALLACLLSMCLAYMAHWKAWRAEVEMECLKDAVGERLDSLADEIEKLKAAKRKAAKGGRK